MITIPLYAKKLPLRQRYSLVMTIFFIRFKSRFDTLRTRFLLWRYGAEVGPGLKVSGCLRCFNKGVIRLGRSVRINSGPDQNYVGGDRQTNIWIAPGALLEIGDEAAISNSTIIARCSVRIGMQAYIGGGCDIYDNDFHELQPEDRICKRGNIGSLPIEIGPKTFIGGHSIILKGVTIGEGAVVGAGSLVTKSIPQYEIWAGRPARFIRKIVLKSDATCLTR